MASPSNSEFESTYDIFLSFRGEDTRKKFTDHLYKALKHEGFHTFRDDDEIPKGKFIKPELRKAIMKSRTSVIVLSKNYANSTACLFELQIILDRVKTSDHFVLPVFFEVDPQEIKEQAQNLDFVGKKVTVEEVKGLSAALTDVAGMKGMVSQNQCAGYEAKFIEKIVGVIKTKLTGEHLRIADHQELEKNMQNLKIKLEYLRGQENDINVEISSAESQPLRRRKKEVEVWLRDVQRLNDDVQRLEKELVGERKVFSRALLGKHILEKIQEVQEHQERGRVFNGLLIDELPIGRLLIPPTKDFVDSKARNKENVWECTMNDDFRKIGVYGMGGVGKTTIIKHIHNLLLEETDKFESVFWVTVSKAFNITTLQRDIGKELNLSLLDGEDETRRASRLYAVLSRKKRYVLILDDLWEAFYLERVGIPEPTRSNGCKLVLTTRSLEVCERMECKAVKVELLTEQEALTLFLSKAVGHDTMLAPEVEEIVTQVAKECACLPLAIVVVAGSMRGLNDHDIPVKEVIEYWIAEGLIADNDSVEAKFDKGHAILRKLTSNSLLERFTDDYQDCIRVHDLIRDMALRITQSSPRFMVKSGVDLESVPYEHGQTEGVVRGVFDPYIPLNFFSINRILLDFSLRLLKSGSWKLGEICNPASATAYEEWSEDLERISLMYSHICELPRRPPNCPRLTTLLLRQNRLSTIPKSFFTYICCLEVLDLSGNMIKSLPESLSNLENLHALILTECSDLVYVPSLEKMKALKVLKLTHSRIKNAPKGIEELVNLRELDLSNNLRLEMFPGSKLHRLSKLQCLRFEGTKVEVSAKDLLCFRQLKVVAVHLHNISELTRYVKSQRVQGLEKYCLAVGKRAKFPRSDGEKNVLIDVQSEPYRNGVLVLPNNITSLELLEFHDLISLSTVPGLKDARHLCSVDIKGCDGLESIFSSSSFSEDGQISLRTVESLDLSHLPSFRVLFDGVAPPRTISFNLKRLSFERCDSVKNIFPAQLLQNFPNLEVLRVDRCKNVEDIVVGEEEMSDSNTTTLPRLRELHLSSLPRLKSIYTGIMVCESVELIGVWRCPIARRLPLFLHMNNEQATGIAPPALEYIFGEEEWWESLGWDDPLAKTILEPFFRKEQLKVVQKLDFHFP